MSEPVLSVHHLCIAFPAHDFEAVKGVSFSLYPGHTLAIVGESGSGKSLLALSLMGLAPNTAVVEGHLQLQINEKTVALNTLSQKEWQTYRGRVLGMIFQEPMSALNPIKTVGAQIKECLQQQQNIGSKNAKSKTLEWIAKVKLHDPLKIYNRYPHQLSGGQKQRIMIAMAMCNEPALLIADEPTTALDATVQQEIVQLMKSLQKDTGTTMIFITHDLALAADIADEVLVMHRGKCVEYGPAKELLLHPQEAYTQALLACRPNMDNKGKRLPIITDYLEGKMTSIALPDAPKIVANEELLSVKNLHIWYPVGKNIWGKTSQYYKAVNGVSLEIRKGQTLGLVGESGCGKSTLGKSLMGLTPIAAGQIIWEQRNIANYKGTAWNKIRRDIQLIFQDPYASLNPRRSIEDIITEPLHIHQLFDGKTKQQAAERLLNLVQLPKTAAKRYPHQFSGGQRQRIGIARALAVQPQLLICDESVSALDVSVQAQILNLLKELQTEFQLSYLFISHDLSVVHYMADKIMVMQQGRIVEENTADNILLHPQNEYTQKLIAAMPNRFIIK